MAAGSKADELRRQRCFHSGHDRVSDPLFHPEDFFDPRDLLLVKCEALRRVRRDREAVAGVVRRFALARSTYYQADVAWNRDGLLGLLPLPSGPRQGYKLTDEVVAALADRARLEPAWDASGLARWLHQFGLAVHPRSVERALRAREKRGPATRRSVMSPTGGAATKHFGPIG